MVKNESLLDRVIRAVLAAIILYFAYTTLTGILDLAGYVVGIILLFTALTGYCHIYKMMGISTLKQ